MHSHRIRFLSALAVSSVALLAQAPPDFASLVFPAAVSVALGSPTPPIYGRVHLTGVTEPVGPAVGMQAQLGYGPPGSDPATSPGWTWVAATYNVQVGGDDEYSATLSVPWPGQHAYAYRFRHNGSSWVHGDLDGSPNGYSAAQAGGLTVVGVSPPPDWAGLQFPSSMLVTAGSVTPPIYGRVYQNGITAAFGPHPGIVAQAGYGPRGTSPASPSWNWVPASFNMQLGNDDEYAAALVVLLPGDYDYAFRFGYYGSAWVYGDLDGSANGYAAAQAGMLTNLGNYPPAYVGGCAGSGPLTLAVTGNPALGGVVNAALQGIGPGVPFHTFEFGPPTQPLLPQCACLVAGLGNWQFGSAGTMAIPNWNILLGATILTQGLELLPAAPACVAPAPLVVSDIWAFAIQ